MPVNGSGRKFLSRTRFAGDEHGRVGNGDFSDCPEQRKHGVARADHLAFGLAAAHCAHIAMRGADYTRARAAVVQCSNPIGVPERVQDTFAGSGERDVIEAEIAHETADCFVIELDGSQQGNPADGLDRQHRLGQAQIHLDVAGRKIEQSAASIR